MNAEIDPLSPNPKNRDGDGRATEVLQQLSHDIRSAMSDVLGGIRLIDTPRLDPQTQTQIDRVRAAADTLAMLVDDALMTAAGEIPEKGVSRAVVMSDWLGNLDRRWAGRAAERGGGFSVQLIGDAPYRLLVPPIVLDRIIGNLVGNALVHGPGRDVVVELTGSPETGLEICVADQGPGFPAHVLDPSIRVGPPASTAGSGLGLGIVQELSAQISATLTLCNDPATGGGRARLVIPAAKVDWSGGGAAPLSPADLSGLRILVAEDNLTNQTILRQMLDLMGAETVIVADGLAAMAALGGESFDIGLIDIEMPRMSGLQVMEQVRKGGGALAKMPLVAITAYVLRDNREAIYAAGADGIIGKPVASADDFGRTILRHVGLPSGLPDTQDVLSGTGLEQKMDMDRLERLLAAAGHHGSTELLDRVVEDLNAVMANLDTGVADCSVPDIRSQTHILIAISGAMGADRLCQMAEVLNIAAKRRKMDQMAQIYAPLRQDLVDLLALIQARRVTAS
ncbi:MAG: response regulator [Roseicyclus sp.]|nr:response regulator [Roseicyclus sp.]